jgi:hypothetical protein
VPGRGLLAGGSNDPATHLGAMEDSASASMKAAGAISPRSGWRQRSGASAPITALSASLICG